MWLEWERAGITSRLPLNRPLTIGRDAGCDIRMAEPTVSRRHAVVSLVGGQPLVDATGSTNGIQLDRGRADRVSLSVGQSFRIGDATFRVIGAQGPAQGPAAVPAAVLGPASCPAVAGAPFGQPPIAYRGSPAPGRPRPRPAMVLGLGAAFLVALVAVAGIGYLAVSKLAPASTANSPPAENPITPTRSGFIFPNPASSPATTSASRAAIQESLSEREPRTLPASSSTSSRTWPTR